jgi:hypothetical protein
MNPLQLFRSLPRNALPPSASVDFLHFVACGKPVVRTQVLTEEGIEEVRAWCHAHGLFIEADRDGFICVARSQCLAEQALLIDSCEFPHETEFGAILGYPTCCCESIAQFGEEAIERAEAEARKWKFTGEFAKIDPAGYRQGWSLICHLPCCDHCAPSLQIAGRALNFIRNHWNSGLFAKWSRWVLKTSNK